MVFETPSTYIMIHYVLVIHFYIKKVFQYFQYWLVFSSGGGDLRQNENDNNEIRDGIAAQK